jgi:DNA polymerase III subunit delta
MKNSDSFPIFNPNHSYKMNFEEIIEYLNQKKYYPIYFLTGDEPYFADKICDFIEDKILQEHEKAFNQTILYGKDVDAAQIISVAKRYPMMSEFQVVIVREAQNIKNIDDLVYYASNPMKTTILVLNYKYKKLDKRKKLYKEIEKNGVLFESKKLYEDKIPAWITKYLKEKGYEIQPTAALLLTDFLGSDLQKIVLELEKLIIIVADGKKVITTTHIEENIGISKDYNNIELQKALVQKEALKVFRIVDYFDHNEKNNPFSVTIASLYFFFSKVLMYSFLQDKSKQSITEQLQIAPYFIADYQQAAKVFPPSKTVPIISILREYDLKSKGSGNLSTSSGDLLKELVYKILSL